MVNAGGLPYLFGTLGATCPVYMSVASNLMTQILFSDTYHMIMQEEFYGNFEPCFSFSGINSALSKIVGVRFSQPIHLTGTEEKEIFYCLKYFTIYLGNAAGIVLTALPAGHSLGGAYWKIRKSAEDILYVSQFNHKKERYYHFV